MIVGIDLGTTHTVVAYAPDEGEPRLFPITQLVGNGQLAERTLLPSFLYAPTDAELPPDEQRLSLPGVAGEWIAGEHARARGAEVPIRAVGSAKSWLSHGAVDRRAPILPWQLAGDPAEAEGESGLARISPVAASSLVLLAVKRAWDVAFPQNPLAEQEVVLTVPASFDAVARTLTVEAAVSAGLSVRLLEEPQAAFYDLMRVGGDEVLERVLAGGAEGLVLVCDVGGGTTDLSLMQVRKAARELEVDRVAVGKHLLLGGDNMDLAIAHLAEPRLLAQGEERLDPRRFAELVARCRAAKERLLAADAPAELVIALAGSGSKLVGATRRTELLQDEVRRIVLDGFLPEIDLEPPAPSVARAALVAFGLPYEREVAITRHLALFVKRHAAEGAPCALLLNGGVFRAPEASARMGDLLRRWTTRDAVVLEHTDPDTSVALGAVAYGLALHGRARRIGGGAAKSVYVGVDSDARRRAVCVLPRGAEEGSIHKTEGHPLELTVGKKVRFDLYVSDNQAAASTLVDVDGDLERLAPLVTTLDAWDGQGSKIGVVLEAELSAVGTLELGCVEAAPRTDKARRFALAFDLREAAAAPGAGHEHASVAARWGKRLELAQEAIEAVYAKRARADAEQREVKGLIRSLEKIFGKRTGWDATLARTLFDLLWRHHRGRRASPDHERTFWMLAGFCLRPGTGHARDPERATAMVSLFEHRLAHPKQQRGWEQFWIAWRRIAAGIDEIGQARLRDAIDPFLAPSERGLKPDKAFKNDARWEMLELGAGLERAPAERRGELGGWILERTWTERDPRLWSALGKVGARVPIYASAHHVVAARAIERWMDHLLREKWEQIPTAPRAAVAMCRVTGDRERDVAASTRAKVAERLTKLSVDARLVTAVRELVSLDDTDRADFYGEELPVGLTLAEP